MEEGREALEELSSFFRSILPIKPGNKHKSRWRVAQVPSLLELLQAVVDLEEYCTVRVMAPLAAFPSQVDREARVQIQQMMERMGLLM